MRWEQMENIDIPEIGLEPIKIYCTLLYRASQKVQSKGRQGGEYRGEAEDG
jgi:hypothetical protein